MAKKTIKYSFSKATLSKENDRYIITEINKDDSETFDFSALLDSVLETSGLSISLNSDDTIHPYDESDGDDLS